MVDRYPILDPPLLTQRDQLLDDVAKGMGREGFPRPIAIEALRRVPREEFLPKELREYAYRNAPVEIGYEQTISQPLIVALMVEHLRLRPTDRVLEIGTGSGYGAAVLAEVAGEVYSVERFEPLAVVAAERLARLGYHRVHVRFGDGRQGWPEQAPYDAIVVTAASKEVPAPLLEQLRSGGRLVIPIERNPSVQRLLLVERMGVGEFTTTDLGDVRFVPLLGGTVRTA